VQSEVTGTQIQAQELNGRNPVYMAQLLPGVRGGATMGDFNFAVGAGEPFQINGARQQDTIVMFDGAPALRTRANGAVIGVADVDPVAHPATIATLPLLNASRRHDRTVGAMTVRDWFFRWLRPKAGHQFGGWPALLRPLSTRRVGNLRAGTVRFQIVTHIMIGVEPPHARERPPGPDREVNALVTGARPEELHSSIPIQIGDSDSRPHLQPPFVPYDRDRICPYAGLAVQAANPI
ncbi:MAG TPA: hypothetical protein VGH38_01380, partial [Bryobacteraceae bacterium]